jgi:hypothetical protein
MSDSDETATTQESHIETAETPLGEIICVDCGGPTYLLTPPPEDGRWLVGDVATYRCRDCRDRWDVVLGPET